MPDDEENEERLITESIARDSQAVHSTVNSRGWKEVIQPALDNRFKALIGDFCNATTYEEFVRIQQSMNAIKSLLEFVEVTLIEGKAALEKLGDSP